MKKIIRLTEGDLHKIIKESVKKTIKHQFFDNLDLDLNDNELELLQRQTDVVSSVACSDDARAWKKKLYMKVLDANSKKGYYNQEVMKKLFFIPSDAISSKKGIFKRGIKKIFRPFYRAYEVREQSIIYGQLSSLEQKVNYLISCEQERNRKDEE